MVRCLKKVLTCYSINSSHHVVQQFIAAVEQFTILFWSKNHKIERLAYIAQEKHLYFHMFGTTNFNNSEICLKTTKKYFANSTDSTSKQGCKILTFSLSDYIMYSERNIL